MRNLKDKTANKKEGDEKKKRLLIVVSVVLVLMLAYQWLISYIVSPPPAEPVAEKKADPKPDKYKNRVRMTEVGKAVQNSTTEPQQAQRNRQEVLASNEEIDQADLASDIFLLENGLPKKGKKGTDIEPGRDPFQYPPPPPPPPAKVLPPPPVAIQVVNPPSVYARTKSFELMVRGNTFQEGMSIYINGSPAFGQTKFVNPNELRVTVPQNMIGSAQQLRIDVKMPGQEDKLYSNPLNLIVNQPPAPTFKMKGQAFDVAEKVVVAYLFDGTNIVGVKLGDFIGNSLKEKNPQKIWKVVGITQQSVELEDVSRALGVRHPIKLEGDQPGARGKIVETGFYSPAQQQQEQYGYPVAQSAEYAQDQTVPAANLTGVSDAAPANSQPSAQPQQRRPRVSEDELKERNEEFRKRLEMLKQRQQQQ